MRKTMDTQSPRGRIRHSRNSSDAPQLEPESAVDVVEQRGQKIRSITISLATVGLTLALVTYAVVIGSRTLNDQSIILERIIVADELKKHGINRELVLNGLRARITHVYKFSHSEFESTSDTSERSRILEVPDLQLPGEAGKFPLAQLLNSLRSTANTASVEVAFLDGKLRLRVVGLRDIADQRPALIESTVDLAKYTSNNSIVMTKPDGGTDYQQALDVAIAPVGEQIVKLRAPYTLASFYQERSDVTSALQTVALAASSGTVAQRSACYNLWGLLLMERGDLEMAVDKFDRALEFESINSYPLVNKGWVKSLQADKLKKTDPARAQMLWEEACCLYAKAEASNWWWRRSNRVLYLNWGTALEYLGEYDERHFPESVKKYKAQMKISVNDRRIYRSLGDVRRKWAMVLRRRNSSDVTAVEDAAVKDYRDAIDVRPEHYASYDGIGQIYAAQGKLLAARRMYLLALCRKPDDSTVKSHIAELLSKVPYAPKYHTEVLKELANAVRSLGHDRGKLKRRYREVLVGGTATAHPRINQRSRRRAIGRRVPPRSHR
jgi:tetratricopeptide (TPR) repeat protein